MREAVATWAAGGGAQLRCGTVTNERPRVRGDRDARHTRSGRRHLFEERRGQNVKSLKNKSSCALT